MGSFCAGAMWRGLGRFGRVWRAERQCIMPRRRLGAGFDSRRRWVFANGLWHILEHCGRFGERSRYDAERAEGKDERQGAEGAKGKTPGWDWVVRAHTGPPIGMGALRFWDPFCASKIREVGVCSGKVGLDFFIFWGEGGCAKVVLDVRAGDLGSGRGSRDGGLGFVGLKAGV